jgi:hypothetical protein
LIVAVSAVPAALIVLVAVVIRKRTQTPLRSCPLCAEKVQVEAKICRFCQRDLPS